MIMDNKRRNFFKKFGVKTAAVATGVETPIVAHVNFINDELNPMRKNLRSESIAISEDLNSKFNKSTAELKGHVQLLHSRLDGAALTLSYQQLQLYSSFCYS